MNKNWFIITIIILFALFLTVILEISDNYNFSDDTTLIDLINDQQDTLAIELINKGQLINSTNKYGNTPLSLTSKMGNKKIVELLIKKGVDVNEKGKNGLIPLLDAAYLSGRSNVICLLFNHITDFNIKDDYGRSLLIHAAILNNNYLVKSLIEKSAEINIKDNFGRTALHYAIKNIEDEAKVDFEMDTEEVEDYKIRRYEVILALLSNNADINIKDKDGNSALSLAENHKDKNINLIFSEKSLKNVKIITTIKK